MMSWPARSRLLTVLTFACGLVFFFWIGAEDTRPTTVTLLGAALPLLLAGHLLTRRFGGRVLSPQRGALILGAAGLLAGSAAPVSTVLLMGLKVSLHDHPRPDFSPQDIAGALARLPAWSAAGLLLGLALALAARARGMR